MNWTLYLENRPHPQPLSCERRGAAFAEPHALIKKAIDRWENEGGKIPRDSGGRTLPRQGSAAREIALNASESSTWAAGGR
jgi:hypothetical protein